jgi:hypothetical protein
MAINFPSDPILNQLYSLDDTTWQWDGSTWNVVSANVSIEIPDIKSFDKIAVAGQTNVVADNGSDTLTFVAGTNVTITTNPTADSITINSTATGGTASNSFTTISVPSQNSIVASSPTATLTVLSGSGISISTDSQTNTLSIEATGAGTFSSLSDISSTGVTVDKIYLPAITMLNVTNIGATAYRFDQYGSTNNPTIYALNGATIAFNLNITGHPFLIQTPGGANFNTGLIHVSTNGQVSTGADAQGKVSGTLYWKIPDTVSGGYRYQCSLHGAMVGSIVIKNFATI